MPQKQVKKDTIHRIVSTHVDKTLIKLTSMLTSIFTVMCFPIYQFVDLFQVLGRGRSKFKKAMENMRIGNEIKLLLFVDYMLV